MTEHPSDHPSDHQDGGEGVGAFSSATGRGLEDSSGAHQRRYRAYQFELVSRHCGPSVLEVGAGLGEFAQQFCDPRRLDRLVVTDVDPAAVASMAVRFAGHAEVEARQLDLAGPPPDLGDRVSTVVAINVLEHLEDDVAALRSLADLVEPGGRLVLWVPGYMQLYGDFDRRVGHVRRYTPGTLGAALVSAGLDVDDVRPVNLLGGVAWWLIVRRGGVGVPRPGLVSVYDRLVVPVTRLLERWARPPFGQSVLAVARVPDRD